MWTFGTTGLPRTSTLTVITFFALFFLCRAPIEIEKAFVIATLRHQLKLVMNGQTDTQKSELFTTVQYYIVLHAKTKVNSLIVQLIARPNQSRFCWGTGRSFSFYYGELQCFLTLVGK